MPTPLERLRQARLVRVLALYASGAFVVLQAIDLFEGQLGLPDAAGTTAEVRRYYAAFIDLWRDADPVLEPRVQSAKARLAQLVRTSG